MAYKISQQDPRDIVSKRKAIGVQMPFNTDSVFIPTYNSLEAYKVNLYNFFMTEKKERYLNPGLGSNLMQYLFSQSPDPGLSRSIQETISFEIERFFPRLEIIQITIDEYPDENMMQITIRFRVKGTELEDNLVLDVNR